MFVLKFKETDKLIKSYLSKRIFYKIYIFCTILALALIAVIIFDINQNNFRMAVLTGALAALTVAAPFITRYAAFKLYKKGKNDNIEVTFNHDNIIFVRNKESAEYQVRNLKSIKSFSDITVFFFKDGNEIYIDNNSFKNKNLKEKLINFLKEQNNKLR